MNLFEYQGKRLYKDFSIPTPKSIFVSSISSISDNHDLNYPLVVKAQVQVGGRGKAGGIKVANNSKELIEYSNEILGMDIKGVESLLIEEASTIQEEYYISFTLDRSAKKYLMMLSSKGGMDIEEVADNNPDDLIKIYISPSEGLNTEVVNKAIKDHQESELDVFDELEETAIEDYEEKEKVTTLAIEKFLSGDVKWSKPY